MCTEIFRTFDIMKNNEKTRFDARLTKEQKMLFEYAAALVGCRSLTEFIITSAQKEADKVIEKSQLRLISSKQDQQIFFDALVNPPKANARLKKGLARYKKIIVK